MTDDDAPPDSETAAPDGLRDGLRALRRDELDDVTVARTLARAEAALVRHAPRASARPRVPRWLVPAALGAWALFYVWGAVTELARIFPEHPPSAVAIADDDR